MSYTLTFSFFPPPLMFQVHQFSLHFLASSSFSLFVIICSTLFSPFPTFYSSIYCSPSFFFRSFHFSLFYYLSDSPFPSNLFIFFILHFHPYHLISFPFLPPLNSHYPFNIPLPTYSFLLLYFFFLSLYPLTRLLSPSLPFHHLINFHSVTPLNLPKSIPDSPFLLFFLRSAFFFHFFPSDKFISFYACFLFFIGAFVSSSSQSSLYSSWTSIN